MRGAIVTGVGCLLIILGLMALNAYGQSVSIVVINNAPMKFIDGNLTAVASDELNRTPTSASTDNEIWDYGDAPDPPYPTLPGHNGARHDMVSGVPYTVFPPVEDSTPDERAGLPTTKWAVGDDDDWSDDEDGIAFDRTLISGHRTKIKVKAYSSTGQAKLNAWIDFNRDGDWADWGEQIFKDVSVINGDNDLEFKVPCNARPGSTYARFRINIDGGLSYDGPAKDGEVQDYLAEIRSCPWAPVRPQVRDDCKEDQFAIVAS
jgi:hypothetical protein